MTRHLLIFIALALSACGGSAVTLAEPDAIAAQEIPITDTAAVVTRTAGPRPGSQAVAPALIVTPGAADQIDAVLAHHDGRAAVVVANGRSAEILFAVDADEPVFAASLYKLGVLLEAERRIDAGTLAPSDLITVTAADQAEGGSFTAAGRVLTVDEALERTIAISDNAAALALIRRLGVSKIQATSIASRFICASPRMARSRRQEGSLTSLDSWSAARSFRARRLHGCWRDSHDRRRWTDFRRRFPRAG